MTSLLPTPQNNSAVPAPSAYSEPMAQPQMELSPGAKNALTTGAMAGILGGAWLAKPKIEGGDALINLEKDKFEKEVGKLYKAEPGSIEATAFQRLKYLKMNQEILPSRIVERIFGSKTSMTQEELLKFINPNAKDIEHAEKSINILGSHMNKLQNLFSRLSEEGVKDGITDKHLEIIEEIIPTTKDRNGLKAIKNAFLRKFPKGTKCTIEEIKAFLQPEYLKIESMHEIKTIALKAVSRAEGAPLSKAEAIKMYKRAYTDAHIEEIKLIFRDIKDKLPKARLAGALKWFGLGILASISIDAVMSLFSRKKAQQ